MNDPVFDGANGSCNDCLATKLAFGLEKKEVEGLRFFIIYLTKIMEVTCWLRMIQMDFNQPLDEETDVAVYGHVHKQLLRYGSHGK